MESNAIEMQTLDGTGTVSDCSPITIDSSERYSGGLRWKLGVNTTPCVQARRGSRCVYCGFRSHSSWVAPDRVGEVVRAAFEGRELDAVRRLELYVSGSFLDDAEVSPSARLDIVRSVGCSPVRETVLESRPEFVTDESLAELAQVIDPARLTIAVGVETMDDELRLRLGKGFSAQDIEQAVKYIARAGMGFQAYLLLKPPLIDSDRLAAQDVLASSRRLLRLTAQEGLDPVLAIQPYFVAGESSIALTQTARPPWLYTIALVMGLLDAIRNRSGARFEVILGNEVDNVETLLVPSNYAADGSICDCTPEQRRRLRQTNSSREALLNTVHDLLHSDCVCRRLWEDEIVAGLTEAQVPL